MNFLATTILLAALLGAQTPTTSSAGCESLGHRAYAAASSSELLSVGRYRKTRRRVYLQLRAGEAYEQMREAAARDGVSLVPISGFRSVAYQRELFKLAVKKYGSETAAARWVAPPGCSEHHTGLAIDIGDLSRPACDTNSCFEKTKTYQWLVANAARFGFNMTHASESGPVAFETWHWRFVGDDSCRPAGKAPGNASGSGQSP
jgi:LAS superfamily LD-carboxypeptidase LdcB